MSDTPVVEIDHEGWMQLAAEEYERLLRLLDDLEPHEWRASTDCPGWDVRAMVAHLCGAADGTARPLEYVRRACVGLVRHRRSMLVDSINEVQIRDRTGRSMRQLRDELEEAGARSVRTRRRIPRAVRGCVVPFGPPVGTASVGYLTDRIFTRDAWMHRIDIARATGRELELTIDHDGALLRDLVTEWAAIHARPFDLRLTGPAGLRMTSAPAGDSLVVDGVEFARCLAGRSSAEGLLGTTVPF
ncbi:MAG TPA: maleylpyruvate isomerase family mycothiol-dependent enzyme [Candidatus Nanopelagicales bacterium]|nr:maleylpyruvate isomerase family mycothiol-dependent enzyme [Candidatus Nanopelagicales bacterium]